MRTLYESILDDIDVQMNVGDKQAKEYKLAHKEFDNLVLTCSNPKNWKGSAWPVAPVNGIGEVDMRYAGVVQDYQIFVKCTNLLKYFEIPARSLFINIHFTPADKDWRIDFTLTSSHQPTVNPNRDDGTIFVKDRKHEITFRFIESSYVNGINKGSKYTIDDIIKQCLLPKLKDINTFEDEIVKPFVDAISKNQYRKYLPIKNI